jgi:UDP-3-O-acyl N-acetylglucosamine deacetylase
MTPAPRRTVSSPVTIEGRGLFTERAVHCVIGPAEAGAGLCFVRTDLPSAPRISATLASLSARVVHPAFAQIPPRHTVLEAADNSECVVYTTEHVLAALAGVGITDAVIKLDAPELPIGDGSAALFTDAIASVGLTDLVGAVDPLTITNKVVVESPDGRAMISADPLGPGESPSFGYELNYGPGSPVQPQTAVWRGTLDAFLLDIAPARTFSLAAEAEQMRALGMFKAFTPRDLLVIDDTGTPIDNTWRFEREPARHKLLDLIGDLALVGRPIHARITSTKGGHAFNHAMARALLVEV